MKLRAGHLSTLYHTSMLLMARNWMVRDFFPCEIEWRLFGTGPAIVNAFRSGELDLAYIGLPPAIIGISQGVPIKCVAGGHVEGTVIASKNEAPGFPQTADLKEILSYPKAIGVPGKGSIHDLILVDAIRSYGVHAEVRNYSWADQVLEAFMHGEVEMAVGTPALAQAIRHYAGGKVVYPPHLLWPDNPSYGILVSKGLLDNSEEIAKKFLVLHEKAESALLNGPDSAATDIADLMAVVDSGFVRDTLRISPRYCAALTRGYIDCTMRLAERLLALGYVSKPVIMEDIFETALIEEIHPGPAHYHEA